MEPHDMKYVNVRSLQERPITLGELLQREELREEMERAQSRSMARSMSPTKCLGPLASGRPRRARGRTLARPSTSAEQFEDGFDYHHLSQQSQQRRRRAASGPLTIPALARMRTATAEARIRNFHALMNESRSRRRGTSDAVRRRHRSLERSDSPDLLFNPLSWQRRRASSAGGRQRRSRSATNSSTRSRVRSSRMIDLYESGDGHSTSSYRYLRTGRPHSGRPDPETRRNTTNGCSQSGIPAPVCRFIDFAAEFIPVEQQPPEAEPPEWSLNITAADLGPFAVGRSALSRARSLAVMGALSQVNNEPTDEEPNADEM